MTTFGVDVSKWQAGSIDWRAAKADGIEFMLARASLGLEVDPKYTKWAAGAEAAGLLPGAYHYLWPGVDPRRAVDLFLATVGDLDGRLIALDVEKAGYWPSSRTIEAVHAWVAEFRKRTQHPLIIYTGKWYWDDRMGDPNGADIGPLWHSRYVTATSPVPYRDLYAKTPSTWWRPGYGGWSSVTILQFTNMGAVKGYSNRMLVDACRGTLNDLRALTTERPMRNFELLYADDGSLITGTLTVKSPDGITTPHWYLRLVDGKLVPATGIVGKVKQAVKVRLTENITPKDVPGVDRRTGYLVGDLAAFLLEQDVDWVEYPYQEDVAAAQADALAARQSLAAAQEDLTNVQAALTETEAALDASLDDLAAIGSAWRTLHEKLD